MNEELGWAARYTFVEDLWRGKARVIVDPNLQAVLRHGGAELAHGLDPAVASLVEDLLPRRGEESVWMGVDSAEVAAQLGPGRPGTQFVAPEGMTAVLRRARWDVALLDLHHWLVDDDTDDATGSDGRRGRSVVDRAADLLSSLGLTAHEGRTVVLTFPVRDYPRRRVGLDYDDVAELVSEQLGGGRVFGLYRPPMAAIVDFAERIDPAWAQAEDEGTEDEAEDEGESLEEAAAAIEEEARTLSIDLRTADEHGTRSGTLEVPDDLLDDDVPLTYDNTLGSQEPAMQAYIAVCGRPELTDTLSEGLCLVELPPQAQAEVSVDGGMRSQLTQARRRADTAVIERQHQVERADALERDNAALRREVAELRDAMARSVADSLGPDDGDQGHELEAALAREQALRWRLSQLESELGAALARPIDELEAEVAELRARLQGASAPAPPASFPSNGRAAEPDPGANGGARERRTLGADQEDGDPDRRSRTTRAVITAMDALLRRIERGGIKTLELRRELVTLRRRLQS